MTPEEAERLRRQLRLDVARDLLSRRDEGWTEEQIDARREDLLARVECYIAARQSQ